jgi:hypothetical protein
MHLIFYKFVDIYIHIYMHICTYKCKHICIYTYVYIHTHKHCIFKYICIYTYYIHQLDSSACLQCEAEFQLHYVRIWRGEKEERKEKLFDYHISAGISKRDSRLEELYFKTYIHVYIHNLSPCFYLYLWWSSVWFISQ